MSEPIEPTDSAPAEVLNRLEAAHDEGRTLFIAALVTALVWLIAAPIAVFILIGSETLNSLPATGLAAGGFMLIVPAALILMTGLMARAQSQARAANSIVLEAATRLLSPLERTSKEAVTFSAEMASAAVDVDKTMGHALSAMKAMAGEIGDERQRLESVAYASADNARELSDRLSQERNALELLTRDLREQTDTLTDAIPTQAQMMVDSARSAAMEVTKAEDALQTRLEGLEQTGRTLAQKVAAMDALAAEAGQRNESLLFAIARMEEKLEQSRKTVETASRAGELAAAAAGTTGDRLMDAVRAALDGAREANSELQKRSLEASETAARSMADLKTAGEATAAAIRNAGQSVRAEIEISKSLSKLEPNEKVPPPPPAVTNGYAESPKAALTTNVAPPREDRPDKAAAPLPAANLPTSPAQPVEEDLFEANADRMAQAMLKEAEEADAEDETPPMMLRRGMDDGDTNDIFSDTPVAKANGGNSISDIIADMERDDHTPLSREETAEALLNRLDDSGIRLTDVFRAKDKKRVALAARKGEKQRRSAISSAAGRQVDRVRKRLRNDAELMSLARDFISIEENDALNALENTHGSSKNASARLATYLLLDAALS